jgi:serine/threonine protein kinase
MIQPNYSLPLDALACSTGVALNSTGSDHSTTPTTNSNVTTVCVNPFRLSIGRSCTSSLGSSASETGNSTSGGGSSDVRSDAIDQVARSTSLATSRSLPDLLISSTAAVRIQSNPLADLHDHDDDLNDNHDDDQYSDHDSSDWSESPLDPISTTTNLPNVACEFVGVKHVQHSTHVTADHDTAHTASTAPPPISPFAGFRFQWPVERSPLKTSLVKLKQMTLPQWFGTSADASPISHQQPKSNASNGLPSTVRCSPAKLTSDSSPLSKCHVDTQPNRTHHHHHHHHQTDHHSCREPIPGNTFELIQRPTIIDLTKSDVPNETCKSIERNDITSGRIRCAGGQNTVCPSNHKDFNLLVSSSSAIDAAVTISPATKNAMLSADDVPTVEPADPPAHAYIRLNSSADAYRPAHWINGVLGCLRPFIGSLGKLQAMPMRHRSSPMPTDANGTWEIPVQDIHRLRWIGSGAQGAVFQGEFSGQPVAVKQVHEQSDTELQHLRRLRHPNVIRLIGVCTKPPSFCIIMEYCEHGSLYEQLKRPQEVPLQRVCDWSRQVCDGMLYLHQNRIIHRDLKSPNVLLSDRFTLKISDFGASRTQGAHSMQMSVAGTVAWMAPEVIRNEKCSEKVDVWAYGVMLWELLTCQVPYAQVESSRVILGVGNHHLRLPIPDACPTGFRALIQRCWSSRPRNRPSFAQLAVSLQPALSETQRTLAAVDLCAVRSCWQSEVAARLAACGSSQRRRLQRNRNQLELAQQLRQHYEQKLQRANRLYAEASALFEQLQQRERQLKRREHDLASRAIVHLPFARAGSFRRSQAIRRSSRSSRSRSRARPPASVTETSTYDATALDIPLNLTNNPIIDRTSSVESPREILQENLIQFRNDVTNNCNRSPLTRSHVFRKANIRLKSARTNRNSASNACKVQTKTTDASTESNANETFDQV